MGHHLLPQSMSFSAQGITILDLNTLSPNSRGFPGGSDSKESAHKVGDPDSIPGSGRSHGEVHGNPLQYSCLENSMDRGAWQATVHGVTESSTTEWPTLSLSLNSTYSFGLWRSIWASPLVFSLPSLYISRQGDTAYCFHPTEFLRAVFKRYPRLDWIPGTEEPGGLPSMGSHRVRHDCSDLAAAGLTTELTTQN